MSTKKFARGVSIIGAAYSHMGITAQIPEVANWSEREFFASASLEAMEDAGIDAKCVDAAVIGHCAPNFFSKATSAGPHFMEWAGLRGKPCYYHDEACATSVYGLNLAAMLVASGMYDVVLSSGVGFNTTVPVATRPPFLRTNLDNDVFWEGMYYAVEPGYDKPGNAGVGNAEAAIIRYLKEYGYSLKNYDEAMSVYIQGQRINSIKNPKAHLFKKPFEEEAKEMGFDSVDEYMNSDIFNPKVGSILRAKYLGQAVDGAATIIVCASDMAAKLTDRKPIDVVGISGATNVVKDYMDFPVKATADTIHESMAMAGFTGKDIDYMAVHDCTGSPLFLDVELAGYFKPGEGMKGVIEGRVYPGGDKQVNTSGGRLQFGHPSAGALGIEITETVKQMRGENGDRQIPNVPRKALISAQGAGFSIATTALQIR